MLKRDVIAVDLGGTNLRVGLVRNGKILKYIKKKTPKTDKELVRELIKTIKSLDYKKVRGIGIGSPGPLDSDKGIILNPPNLPFKNFNLKNTIEKATGKKVVLENDANCVALAESKFGVKKKNIIVLTIGTGVGGGVIINGKLFQGQGRGGELGHMILNNGKDLEDLVAKKAQIKLTKKYFGKEILIKDLLKMNNPKARKILLELFSYLGQGIASLINIFDPEVVVLAGGFREAGKPCLDLVKQQVKKHSIIQRHNPIVWSKLNHPGILGASLLV